MKSSYHPEEVEQSAQAHWSDHQTFEAKEDLSREKFYCLSMLPYPSGDLHMGHIRNYTIGDVITRYQFVKGKNVLQPMGWDAFGLPAENAAIQRKLSPAEWTQKNIKKMRKQFQQMGYGIAWKREIATCDPSYYVWEQWLFLQLYKKGLVYKKNAMVNWDPVDQTVLANEQVIDGKGWRSGAPVERREISQWFIKITEYADELLDDLDNLKGWPEQVKTMQANWIGRSHGTMIQFPIHRRKKHLQIFTTRPDTLMGCTYLAIAPQHPLAIERAEKNEELAKFLKKCKHIKMAEADIATQEKEGIDTGLFALHPITQEKLPIWVTNFVLMEYGSGAVMSVPAHDQRDFEFAQKYNLPFKQVIKPNKGSWDFNREALTTYEGTLINSGEFNGLTCKKAVKEISNSLIKNNLAETKTNYRLRDWGISRQRYWGTPIPIIHCEKCGELPVPEEELPVLLPTDLIPTGSGSPLKKTASFYKTKCPKCKKSAKRETDTMDTFVESSWYYARYCSFDQENVMLDDRAKYWTPVDQYIGGIEHAVLHLLYARFIHKILRDLGLLNSNEPFTNLLTQGMVLKDGHKMSKSKGNIVAPQTMIKKFGADTVRLFIIFAAPPDQSLEWSDTGIEGSYRFLCKLWKFAFELQNDILVLNQKAFEAFDPANDKKLQNLYKDLHAILQQATQDMERLQFNTVVSASMKLLNLLSKINPKTENELQLIREGFSILLRILAPITPHITHQLWRDLGYEKNILDAHWPKVNEKALQVSQVDLVVQVNGKLRSKITVDADAPNESIEKAAITDEKIQRVVGDQKVKKIIVIPKRLVNIVI